MKYTTKGNCPFCDSETSGQGIGGWGMSPEGWGQLQERHNQNHSENRPQTTADVTCPHCHMKIENNGLPTK